ncbi:hypothetical protein FACS189421_13040 [Bacteroidia bacterium]|nr:hypothetical protein FACS189421_13040 [Bacteroidia bacterium]
MDSMKRLAIIGSGDLGQLIAHHAETDGHYHVVGFFDDYKNTSENVDGYPILGGLDAIEELFLKAVFDCVIIAIGYKHMTARKDVYENLKEKIPFGKVLHSSCYVDGSCKIGDGTVLLPGCVLDRNVCVGDNVLVNVGVTIAHDSTIKNHSFLSPRVAIAGFTEVGECCNIGISTIVIDNLLINSNIQKGGVR